MSYAQELSRIEIDDAPFIRYKRAELWFVRLRLAQFNAPTLTPHSQYSSVLLSS